MKAAFITCGILLLSLAASCQNVQEQCGSHPNLLRDNSGVLKMLASEQLESLAVKTVLPEPVPLPASRDYAGVVSAKIMINTSGDVVCLWDAAGHPVMIPAAIRAIHQWKFKPMVVDGKKVEFVGRLKVAVRSRAAQ